MSASERNFNDFYLGDNVYELAGGVIPEIAERLGIKLSTEPNSAEMHGLVGAIGKNKVLRDNSEVTAIDRETKIDFVERSGILLPLERSLWRPEIKPTDSDVSIDAIVMTGGTANWMNRSQLIIENYIDGSSPTEFESHKPEIIIATGCRQMDTATEKNIGYIASFYENVGQYPDETEYASDQLISRLSLLGKPLTHKTFDTEDGAKIATRLFERRPDLLEKKLLFARVASAGIQLGIQMRKAARAIDPMFDQFNTNAQVFVVTDTKALAQNDEQEADPLNYQKADPALRQLGVTAKMIHEASGGE